MQRRGTTVEGDTSDGAFAQTDSGDGGRAGWNEECREEERYVGVMADNEDVFLVRNGDQEILEVLEGRGRGEGFGVQNWRFVAGFGADKRSCLQAALERTGDDDVELNLQGVEDGGELEAVALAFFIKRTLLVDQGIHAAGAGACMAKNKQIHNLFTIIRLETTAVRE